MRLKFYNILKVLLSDVSFSGRLWRLPGVQFNVLTVVLGQGTDRSRSDRYSGRRVSTVEVRLVVTSLTGFGLLGVWNTR